MLYLQACDQPDNNGISVVSDDYKKADSLFTASDDSAFYYFNRAATASDDSLQSAMAYTYMAIIQSDKGDYYGAQESLLQSLQHLDEKIDRDHPYLLSDFNELGSVSLNLKNYDAAITYYNQALKYSTNEDSRVIALSNKAVAYQKKKEYAAAISIYDSILDKTKNNQKRYARILSNREFTRWLDNPQYNAIPGLIQAYKIREKEQDRWGLNASYAHLADYYFLSKPDSALFYAGRMHAMAQQLNSPDDELEAMQKLVALAPPDSIKEYFKHYRFLDDSLQTSRNNARNQFAIIRYNVEKSKADNLILQKDNADKRLQILGLLITLTAVIVLATIMFQWLKKRRQRLLQEQQLRTSQKVHDVVANGLYHIMAKIEYTEPDRAALLDDIERLYEQSRNISYDQPEETTDNYHKSIEALLSSFATPGTTVSIVGNAEETWSAITLKVKSELQNVLKELMVNMKKHSSASNVVIRFDRGNDVLAIHYTDDGVGLAKGIHQKNGLRNTENRISGIGGNISFDTAKPKGLKIQLSIPIS